MSPPSTINTTLIQGILLEEYNSYFLYRDFHSIEAVLPNHRCLAYTLPRHQEGENCPLAVCEKVLKPACIKKKRYYDHIEGQTMAVYLQIRNGSCIEAFVSKVLQNMY